MEEQRKVMNEQIKGLLEAKCKKDDFDISIQRELEKIRLELFDKLVRMFQDLKSFQMNQKSQMLSLQREISLLKKEKLDLYQKTTELQRKISDMETIIGYGLNQK